VPYSKTGGLAMKTPAIYDITIHQGATFELQFQFQDSTGTPIDLTGFSIVASLWNRLGTQRLANFSVPWVEQASGIFKLRLDNTVTSGVTEQGTYDILATQPNNDKFYIVEGNAFWNPGLSFKS